MKLPIFKAFGLWIFFGLATAYAQPNFQFNIITGIPPGFNPTASGPDYLIDSTDPMFIGLQTPNAPARFLVDLSGGMNQLDISVDSVHWGQINLAGFIQQAPDLFNTVVIDNSLSNLSIATMSDSIVSQGVYFQISHATEFTLQASTSLIGDFDLDGDVDADDIDLLQGEVLLGSNDLFFDITNDSLVTSADTDEIVQNILNTAYGDANLDQLVDSTDHSILLSNYGKTSGAGWASAEFTGEGNVGLSDLLLIKKNFGFGVPPAPAAVPEPNSYVLILFGLLAIGSFRMFNRHHTTS